MSEYIWFCGSYESVTRCNFFQLDSRCSWGESMGGLAARMQSMVRADRMEVVLCFCHCICQRFRTRALTSARWSSSFFCSSSWSSWSLSSSPELSGELLGAFVIASAADPTTPRLEPATALSHRAAPRRSESGRRSSSGAPPSDPRRLSLVPDWFILCNAGGRGHRRQDEKMLSHMSHMYSDRLQ